MNNLDRIRQKLPEYNLEAIMITSSVNRLFATGFPSSDGALVITGSDAWFYTDFRYIEAAQNSISCANINCVTKDATYAVQIEALLNDIGIKSVGFEDGIITYAEHLEWAKKLTAALSPAQKLLDELRAVKTESELIMLKKAQSIAEKTFTELLPLISTEMTERELAAEIIFRAMKNGADDKSFDPIVVSGTKSSMPHGVPGDIKISKGFLTIDFGVRLDGWCSDTTRTLCIGQPDDEMRKIYDTVLKAQEAGIASARAGVPGCDIDAAARVVIENAGYGENFGHGFGHGLGLEVHEKPTASPIYDKPIPAGAVISAEPGIYIPDRYGVRIEDVIFITDNGCENITKLPKDLIIL